MSVIVGFKELPDQQWSDEILAARIAKGDVAALEILYDRHAAMILGMALRITGDQALAEEVLQETFWRIWRPAVAERPVSGAFTAWLFRTARSLAMDVCRRENN